MICSNCHTDTVVWVGPNVGLTHTECLTCGGVNCQVIPQEEPEEGEGL
jgi:hypothetical protein